MEHLRLLLPMVLSMARTRADSSGPGEWQEDSGLGLYRAPEEGVNMGAGAAASVPSVDIEKKVSLNGLFGSLLTINIYEWGSECICCCCLAGERFRKHRVRPEPRGGAQLGYDGGFRTSAPFRPGKNWKPLQQNASAGADTHNERPAAVWNWTAVARAPVLHLRRDIRLENLWLLAPQTGRRGRSNTSNVLSRWDERKSPPMMHFKGLLHTSIMS